jgi:hypothetical protein
MELGNETTCQEVVLEKKLVDEWRASFPALPRWTGSA